MSRRLKIIILIISIIIICIISLILFTGLPFYIKTAFFIMFNNHCNYYSTPEELYITSTEDIEGREIEYHEMTLILTWQDANAHEEENVLGIEYGEKELFVYHQKDESILKGINDKAYFYSDWGISIDKDIIRESYGQDIFSNYSFYREVLKVTPDDLSILMNKHKANVLYNMLKIKYFLTYGCEDAGLFIVSDHIEAYKPNNGYDDVKIIELFLENNESYGMIFKGGFDENEIKEILSTVNFSD